MADRVGSVETALAESNHQMIALQKELFDQGVSVPKLDPFLQELAAKGMNVDAAAESAREVYQQVI